MASVELLDGLAEVDDVDGVALLENEGLHLRVPALGLVAKVDAGLEKFRHQFSGHKWAGNKAMRQWKKGAKLGGDTPPAQAVFLRGRAIESTVATRRGPDF